MNKKPTAYWPRSGRANPNSFAQRTKNLCGFCTRMPAPSPARGSAPTAPRCSRLRRIVRPSLTIWCDDRPLMSAMKPTPQESFSKPGSKRPEATAEAGRSDSGARRAALYAYKAARLAPESDLPASAVASGLFDPGLEKDSCGVGFIADIKGRSSHQIVKDGLTILLNLEHRGAVGADPRAGDGAGILVQKPHKFFVRCAKELGFVLPERGQYAVGFLFMPN